MLKTYFILYLLLLIYIFTYILPTYTEVGKKYILFIALDVLFSSQQMLASAFTCVDCCHDQLYIHINIC